jgi:hypothetical protein
MHQRTTTFYNATEWSGNSFTSNQLKPTICNRFQQSADIGLGVRGSLVPPKLLARDPSEKATGGSRRSALGIQTREGGSNPVIPTNFQKPAVHTSECAVLCAAALALLVYLFANGGPAVLPPSMVLPVASSIGLLVIGAVIASSSTRRVFRQ